MIEVIALAPFIKWYAALEENDQELVSRAVDLLSMPGMATSHPCSRTVPSATFGLRELGVRFATRPHLLFYALDAARATVLLLDATSSADERVTELAIAQSEKMWRKYLDSLKPRRPA